MNPIPWLFVLVLAMGAGLSPDTTPTRDAELPTRFEPAPRIVAIGDVHGDLGATRRALRLAGATDENDTWVGGELVVVQTGDQVDRGDQEQAILDLFARLSREAAAAGGAFHVLNGNHELMNARLDLRYVTEGGFRDFEDAVEVSDDDSTLIAYPDSVRARVVAFRPGGRYAKLLAGRHTILIVGENLFVHGGVLPEHVDYGIDRINHEARAWLRGEAPIPEWLTRRDSPVWARQYSDEVDGEDCEMLAEVLGELGVARMIVGHTVQEEGITSYCDDRVWCIDTGMAAAYGGPVRVLEITGDGIRELMESLTPE